MVMGPVFRAAMTDGTVGEIDSTIQITDERAIRLIAKRGYRGLSVEFNIERYVCSICNRDYEECSHENVALIPKGLTFMSASIVRNPKARTYMTDVLIVKTKKNRRHYRWIGYRSGRQDRMERISARLKSGHISATSARVISDYFLTRKSGECRYFERIQ